jgi:hypothetical protein
MLQLIQVNPLIILLDISNLSIYLGFQTICVALDNRSLEEVWFNLPVDIVCFSDVKNVIWELLNENLTLIFT